MSTILTNGLKLPDKGSVDWYADMQNNYTILDGAVGTVAEHTTALAGKAPAVHTHTKSDVTDLFNSANTWSALNSYSNGQIRIKSQNQEIGVIPSSGVIQYLEFADKNDAQHGIVGLWDYAGGASEIQMYISDKFKNGTKDPTGTSDSTFLSFGFKADGNKFLAFSGQVDNSVIPKSNNIYDLGSSSYKWKTLNGINPGALSLPQVATNFEDLTGYVLDGVTENRFPISGVMALDGWLQCRVKHTLGTASFLRMEMSYRVWTAQDKDCVSEYTLWVPVKAGMSFDKVICLADDLKIRFHPCFGNV